MPPTGRPGLRRGATEKFGVEELPGYSHKQASKPLNLFSAGATNRESSDYIIGGRTSAQKQMSNKKMIGGTQSSSHENKKVNMAGITSSSKKIRNMKPPCPAAIISH